MPLTRTLHRLGDEASVVVSRGQSLLRGAPAPLPAAALECVLGRNEHGEYCVPSSSLHRPAAIAVRRHRVYEPDTLRLLREAPAGDIVHAGTFFGDFLPGLASSRTGDAVIWAFEPNPESYRCAQITALLNGLTNVRLMHAALHSGTSDDGRLATLDPGGQALGGASHLLAGSEPDAAGVQNVHLAAVDDVVGVDRQVTVVQLDVEGNEEHALTGALATITRCRPMLVLETLPDADWVRDHLGPLGYRVTGSSNLNSVLRCD